MAESNSPTPWLLDRYILIDEGLLETSELQRNKDGADEASLTVTLM